MDSLWFEAKRNKKRQLIEFIFDQILNDFKPYISNPSGPLRSSILVFKNELLKEVQTETFRDPDPLETARQYQATVKSVLSHNNFLSDKLVSIEKFRNQAIITRNKPSTNAIIGVAIGALVSVALIVGVVALVGPNLFLNSTSTLLKGIISSVAPITAGGLVGGLFGAQSSKQPDFDRGKKAAEALENFSRNQGRQLRY